MENKTDSLMSSNNLLKAAEDKIESNLLPENKVNYQKLVVAGLKVALANGPQSYMAQLKNSKDPLSDAATGAVNLVFMLNKQARGTAPIQAMVPAAMTLMLHALDFIDRTGMMTVGQKELGDASKKFADVVFRNMNITPQMLKKASESVHNVAKDPAHLEAMKRKAGLVRAPGASVPTDVPEEVPTDAV